MATSQHKRPFSLGVIVAALCPPLVTCGWLLCTSLGYQSATDMWRSGWRTFALMFVVSLIVMLFAGLPYAVWLRSRNSLNVLAVCAGSVVIGMLTIAGLSAGLSYSHQMPQLSQLLTGGGLGLAAGVGFCAGVGSNAWA